MIEYLDKTQNSWYTYVVNLTKIKLKRQWIRERMNAN